MRTKMTEIIFKNRITQEAPNIIKQLKSLWIDMNLDKKQTQNKFISKQRIETPTYICSELFDSTIPA